MKDRERDENEQSYYRIMDRDHWRCQYPGCGKPATERAHRIAKTQANQVELRSLCYKYLGCYPEPQFVWKHIVNSDLNMAASCRKHNDYFNIGNRPEEVKALVKKILGGLPHVDINRPRDKRIKKSGARHDGPSGAASSNKK